MQQINKCLQKQFILCDLNKIYLTFNVPNREKILELSKSAVMATKYCVCVCQDPVAWVCYTYHQNVRFAVPKTQLQTLDWNKGEPNTNFGDFVQSNMQCTGHS